MYRTTRGLIVGSSVQPQTVTWSPRVPGAATCSALRVGYVDAIVAPDARAMTLKTGICATPWA